MRLGISRPVDAMDGPYARRWWALGVLCISLLIIVMANTSLTVAAPDMVQSLGLGSSDLQWVIDGYTVPYAALMLILGAVGDKYSRRGALVLGLLVFAGASVAGSLVDSAGGVIASRAAMGVGAAMIMPATLSLLAATFPRAERAKAITIWTATAGLAIAVGPLVAGALLEDHGWASTFLINVPIALLGAVGALFLVPPSKAENAENAAKIDYIGGLLSVIWVGSLIYMIIEGPHFGWGAKAITAAVVAGVGFVCFVLWELRHPRPVLDVRRFAKRAFAGSTLAVALFFLAVFGAFYYLTQHLQFVLGYSPLDTGVRMLPLAGAVFVGGALTAFLTPRFGMKITVALGMTVGTVAIALLTRVDASSSYDDFVLPLIILGLAIGLSLSPCTNAIMGSFPESQLGVGGAVNSTSIELGGSLGIAILGTVLAKTYSSNLGDAAAKAAAAGGPKLPEKALSAAQDSVGAGLYVAKEVGKQVAAGAAPKVGPEKAAALGAQQAQTVVDAVHKAFADSVAHTSVVGAVILGIGTVVVAFLLPRKASQPQPAAAERSEERETERV
ncbi:MFS transporter [Streptomyces mobaraensis NBRC 13819 = DSM 40847]|uniref:Transmembrane efflux protein n=1 Tax=Streptomyces mobaraensis (strain ATCC 29032 / DSM 40847 / JCM 4168 / NBRC 13819 / NCIMB 11159 / IPCR 16-22) TaxID=1223523 RepID=M3C605_STRM1|nr:MFS transporter [Streptomyces mobaraensis]EME99380.1 transmembrane efflux protein [Streptomyces mobaraensis NBRC 13819 = DSM 40847]QTT75793.1 MFS transporter [Streptomyces mobaraensis NBRC 13819 = DSM 40847]